MSRYETGLHIKTNGYWIAVGEHELIVADTKSGILYGLDMSMEVKWQHALFEKEPSEILGMCLLPDTRLALARKHILETPEIVLLDTNTFESTVRALPMMDDEMPQLCQLFVLSPDGSYLCPRYTVFDVENEHRIYTQRLFRKDYPGSIVLGEQGAEYFYGSRPNRDQWIAFLRTSCISSLQPRVAATFLRDGRLALVRGSRLVIYDPSTEQESFVADVNMAKSEPWEPLVQLWADRFRFRDPVVFDEVVSANDLRNLTDELKQKFPVVKMAWQLITLGDDGVGVVDQWAVNRQGMKMYRLDGAFVKAWEGTASTLFWDDLAPSAVWFDGRLYSPMEEDGQLVVIVNKLTMNMK